MVAPAPSVDAQVLSLDVRRPPWVSFSTDEREFDSAVDERITRMHILPWLSSDLLSRVYSETCVYLERRRRQPSLSYIELSCSLFPAQSTMNMYEKE